MGRDPGDCTRAVRPRAGRNPTRMGQAAGGGVSERMLYYCQAVKRAAPDLMPAVAAGTLTLAEARREVERREWQRATAYLGRPDLLPRLEALKLRRRAASLRRQADKLEARASALEAAEAADDGGADVP